MKDQIASLKEQIVHQFEADHAPLLKKAIEKRSADEFSVSEPIEITTVKTDEVAKTLAPKRRKLQDQGIGSFFRRSTKMIKLPDSNVVACEIKRSTPLELQRPGTWTGLTCRHCKGKFENAQGLGMHTKSCQSRCLLTGKTLVEARPNAEDAEDDEVFTFGSGREGESTSSKLTIAGRPKRTKGSTHRNRFMLRTKITVLDYYKKMSLNNILHAHAATIDAYPFCANGILTDWIRKETEIRGMMKTSKFESGVYADARACSDSRQARKLSLHAGKAAAYPHAESETYNQYLEWRAKGIRVGGRTLKRVMKKNVLDEHGAAVASHFMASRKWLVLFAKRHRISLKRKSNKKPLPAEQRIPKVMVWFAKLVRRLKRFKPSLFAKLGKQGGSSSKIISVQGESFEKKMPSVLWARDCGLAAIRNVTTDPLLNLDDLLITVRPLQTDLEARTGSVPVNFLAEGIGNFNGAGLMQYLESRGYCCVVGHGHLSDLLELLCLSFKSNLCGVVWHEGANVEGHWLCASYVHSEVGIDERVWFHKDSVGPTLKELKTRDVITVLGNAVALDQHCFIVLNCN